MNETKKLCVVMVGPSGSGKTTLSKHLFPSALRVSADEVIEEMARKSGRTYRETITDERLRIAVGRTKKKFVEALAAGKTTVVVDCLNLRSRDRKFFMQVARTCGYEVLLYIMPNLPLEALERRAEAHGTPRSTLDMQVRQQKLPAGIYIYEGTTVRVGDLVIPAL